MYRFAVPEKIVTDSEAPSPEEFEDRPESLRARLAGLRAKVTAHLLHKNEPFDSKAFLDEAWDWPHGDFSKTDINVVFKSDEDGRS